MFSVAFDLSDLESKVTRHRQELLSLGAVAMDNLGNSVAQSITSGRYYTNRTGALSRSVEVQRISPLQRRVIAKAKHASYVDQGTRPHVIQARRAKALRFVMGGVVVFRRSVHHPGTRPRDFSGQERSRVIRLLPDVALSVMERSLQAAGLA